MTTAHVFYHLLRVSSVPCSRDNTMQGVAEFFFFFKGAQTDKGNHSVSQTAIIFKTYSFL